MAHKLLRHEEKACKQASQESWRGLPSGLGVQVTTEGAIGLAEKNSLAERTDRSLPAILRTGGRLLTLAQLLNDGDGGFRLRRLVTPDRALRRALTVRSSK
eukprot:759203-Hanusia_phi.AAC.5